MASSAMALGSGMTVEAADAHSRAAFRPGLCALKRALQTSIPLVAADTLGLATALAASVSLTVLLGFESGTHLLWNGVLMSSSLVVANGLLGLYPGVGLNPVVELRQSACATSLVFAIFMAVTRLPQMHAAHSGLILLLAWPVTLINIPLFRACLRWFCARFTWWGQNVLIVAGGRSGALLYQHLLRNAWLGMRPVGIVNDFPASGAVRGEIEYLGPLSAAGEIARSQGVPWAIIAMPERTRAYMLSVLEDCAAVFPHVLVVADQQEMPNLWTCPAVCGGLPGLYVHDRLLQPLPRIAKRVLDLAMILAGAVLVFPLMALVSLLIKVGSPGPVFYCQQRIGRDGRRFQAWKFRTMVQNAEGVLESYLNSNAEYRAEWDRDHKLRNDPRVTRVGSWLRKTSLDELPQLWNVLRGEMSLVGPRPIVDAEIDKYSESFAQYVKVIPGITGLWQVSGRNDTTYAERVALDSFYARNWSPWLDLFILACTIKVVLRREGAY